jgi:hypothetical protein
MRETRIDFHMGRKIDCTRIGGKKRLRTAWLIAMIAFSLGASGSRGQGVRPMPGAPPDALDEALALLSMTRADLGFQARGYWERYPEDIPYKLRHFDDLCAEPLAIVPFVRAMGATVRLTLAPEMVSGKKNDQGAGALYRAVHDLGINKRYGATRPYSANLIASATPLHVALIEAWRQERRASKFVTFGKESPYPVIASDLEKSCAGLPADVSAILGKLVLDLLDARGWAVLAFRNVPLETRVRCAARLDLGEKETDALDYEPAMDDAAHAWDESSLWYAGLKTVEALDVARLALARTLPAARDNLDRLMIDIDTPAGRVIVSGTGKDRVDVGTAGAFLIVDLGGDDAYAGAAGGSNPGLPVGAALDMGGSDVYESQDRALGAGVTGIGVLLDASGGDSYSAYTLGEGVGHFGLGALIDLEGDDTYKVRYSGQGAGFFGIGVLIDVAGSDSYTLWSDGQGFGGVAGIGVLADRAGDDVYLAVPDPAVTGRPSYHSEGKIAVSDAQGCGMGRRGDGADGHSWAGGIGALLDAEGNDTYTAGNWGQGCGYWFGSGFLWDGSGNDTYHANGWASASGAHFCIGAVVDEAGDDVRSVAQNWGPAFGHDFTVAILADASGNDRYECGGEGIGHSINRSVALCLDGGGDDAYVFKTVGKRPGLATFDPRFLDRTGASIYWTESTSIGLFLDTGGTDTYPVDMGVADDVSRVDDPASENARARNVGVFVDRPDGAIDFDRPQGGKRR